MNPRINLVALILLALPCSVLAAEVTGMSPTGGVLKMVLGLAVVLAVMALISWGIKRMMPGVANKQSIVRVVGGVSVGPRERVVVLEVAGRWIVIGVAPGKISRLGNLDVTAMQVSESNIIANHPSSVDEGSFTNTFAQWLTKSTGKILEKKDVKN
ncbi:MAG: flagellar biosynthetic protein FliO [Methylotenera sp.]|nr:flagellar biosynthetic protein FliO [Methylotenera sp.]